MWNIQFQARCANVRSKLSALSAREAAYAIESALSVALLELSDEVSVEHVWVEVEDQDADDESLRAVCAADATRAVN